MAEFVANLNNALKVRPVTPLYPKISAAMGQAIQAVLLGKKQPQEALSEAADQVNADSVAAGRSLAVAPAAIRPRLGVAVRRAGGRR